MLVTRDICLRILRVDNYFEYWAEWQVRLVTGQEKRVVRLPFGEEKIIEKPHKQRGQWGQPTARERIDKAIVSKKRRRRKE
jgi:hypothetical protein